MKDKKGGNRKTGAGGERKTGERRGTELVPKKRLIANMKTWYREQRKEKIVSKTFEKEKAIILGGKKVQLHTFTIFY